MKTTVICMIGLLGLFAVNAVQVSSRLHMKQDRDYQCPIEGAEVNVDDEIERFGVNLPQWNRLNNPNDWDDAYDDSEDILEGRIFRTLSNNRNGFNGSNAADNDNNTEYNSLIADLRALLYIHRNDIDDDININNNDIDDTVLNCTILVDTAAIPQDREECAVNFRTIEPHLVNFVKRAYYEDSVEALYWILNTLEYMPTLASNCLNQNFRIPLLDQDDGDCEDEIEATANLLISVALNNQRLLIDNRISTLISRRIPRIVAHCFGTDD